MSPPNETEHGLNTMLTYSERHDMFNEDWKKYTPTIRIKMMAEYERDLQNITLQATTKRVFGSGFHMDVILMIFIAVAYILIIFLFYVNFMNRIPNVAQANIELMIWHRARSLKVCPTYLKEYFFFSLFYLLFFCFLFALHPRKYLNVKFSVSVVIVLIW